MNNFIFLLLPTPPYSNSSQSPSPRSMLVILFCYAGMFRSIRVTRASTPLSGGYDDREFALRFFFIVATDCLCWTPILVLKGLAVAQIPIPREKEGRTPSSVGQTAAVSRCFSNYFE